MQFVYIFYLYINRDIKGENMYFAALHHHMRFHSNPFAMGYMGMSPRINFFLGMAAATSMVPYYPMFNPFMNSLFSFPAFSMPMFVMNSNPFAFSNIPNYNFMSLPTPAVNNNFQYNKNFNNFATPSNTSIFGNIKLNSDTAATATDTISYSSYSKIKPGLLKGNLVGKEAVITQLCEKYGVDVALVVSIIGQESGFGTSNLAKHNNFMGYRAAGDCGKSANGFGYFSTPEKGLEVAIRNLSKYPERYPSVKKADMNNIDAIGRIYCEGTTYASAIKNIYNKTVKEYLA